MILNIVILALVTAERIGELFLSRRNTAQLLARGAREHAPRHYPLIVAVHVTWLAALWWFAPKQPIQWLWLVAYIVVEMGRAWVLTTLGRRWTTRIIVLPCEPLIQRGPYRYVNHPNYWVVVAEIAALPLAFGLWRLALLFTVLNAVALGIRMRAENRALSAYRSQ